VYGGTKIAKPRKGRIGRNNTEGSRGGRIPARIRG